MPAEIGTGRLDTPELGSRNTSVARTMWRLLRSLFERSPSRTVSVVMLTFAVILTSGISLVMLVPLLGVAGLDVDVGSIGRIADAVRRVLGTLGLELNVPTVIVAYVLIVVVNAAVGHVHAVQKALLYQAVIVDLRVQVFEAITRTRWVNYVQRPSSGFVHVLTREVERVGATVAGAMSLVISAVMTLLYLALALYVSPAATLFVAACGGVLMALLARQTRLGRARGEAVSRSYEALYAAISEHLSGMRVTKGHGAEAIFLDRFRDRTERTAAAQVDVVRNQADVGFWLHTGSAGIMAGVFAVAFMVLDVPLAGLLLLLYLFARLVPNLTGLQRQVQQVLNQLPAYDRVQATVAWLNEHAEPAASDEPAPRLARSLRMERVSFAYPGGDGEAMLHEVDLEVLAGRTTAIVGPSGGGKSTVADIVAGLLTPDRGRVVVDDIPLAGDLVDSWRKRIGYVNQDPFLFDDTIRANLTLVRPHASEDEIRAALTAAAASFVDSLPMGLDTVVGERGVRLSGGERQRLALARAILREPVLLVLDEATSALDAENERVIQDAIDRMAGKRTLLVISHRLASVRAADHIYVLEKGRVVESGGWDDLVGRPQGRFRALCVAQGLLVS